MKVFGILIGCVLALPLFAQVVENGMNPKKGHTLELIEDLSFGSEEDEEVYIWPHPGTKIVPDSRGHMYIFDPMEGQVLEFDKDGKYVQTAIKPGEGPGELQGILNGNVSPDDSVIVFAGRMFGAKKVMVYSPQHKFLDATTNQGTGVRPIGGNVSPRGDLIGINFSNVTVVDGAAKIEICAGIVSKDFKVVKKLTCKPESPRDNSRIRESAYWSEILGEQMKAYFEGIGLYNFGAKGTPYTGFSHKYAVTKWNDDLSKEVMTIKRKYKPIAYTEEELEAITDILVERFASVPGLQELLTKSALKRAMEIADAPPVKNPVFGFVPMEDGGLMVVHDLDMVTRDNLVDLYDKKGAYLGQTRLKNYAAMSHDLLQLQTRMVFRNGFIYTIETDEDGENRAVRYKYKIVKKSLKRDG